MLCLLGGEEGREKSRGGKGEGGRGKGGGGERGVGGEGKKDPSKGACSVFTKK